MKQDHASHSKYPFSRIKVEDDDSLDLDEEEDSPSEEDFKEKDQKKDPKTVDGKPPYSYVAMIGKSILLLYIC